MCCCCVLYLLTKLLLFLKPFIPSLMSSTACFILCLVLIIYEWMNQEHVHVVKPFSSHSQMVGLCINVDMQLCVLSTSKFGFLLSSNVLKWSGEVWSFRNVMKSLFSSSFSTVHMQKYNMDFPWCLSDHAMQDIVIYPNLMQHVS